MSQNRPEKWHISHSPLFWPYMTTKRGDILALPWGGEREIFRQKIMISIWANKKFKKLANLVLLL